MKNKHYKANIHSYQIARISEGNSYPCVIEDNGKFLTLYVGGKFLITFFEEKGASNEYKND